MAQMRTGAEVPVEEKVAIFLASLDEQTAAAVLQQLDPEVMTRIVSAIRSLGVVPGEVRDNIMQASLQEIHALGEAVFGDDKLASNLLVKAIGEKRASGLLSDQNTRKETPFAGLRQADPEELANALMKEQPSVTALVVKYLPSNLAADILNRFPGELRKQVMINITVSNVMPLEEVITSIEKFLESKLVSSKAKKNVSTESKDKVDVMAGILQHLDPGLEEEMMTLIEENSRELAEELRDKLFTFEDIVNLSDVAVRRILQEVDSSGLSVALRNASVALKQKIFGNMSKRASEGVKEDMANSPKVRLADIESKQREIVNIIRALESQGQIVVSRGEEDVYV